MNIKCEKEVKLLNEGLEAKVEEQTRDIRSILSNIHQGITSFTAVIKRGLGGTGGVRLNSTVLLSLAFILCGWDWVLVWSFYTL